MSSSKATKITETLFETSMIRYQSPSLNFWALYSVNFCFFLEENLMIFMLNSLTFLLNFPFQSWRISHHEFWLLAHFQQNRSFWIQKPPESCFVIEISSILENIQSEDIKNVFLFYTHFLWIPSFRKQLFLSKGKEKLSYSSKNFCRKKK